MLLTIKVNTHSNHNAIEQLGEFEYKISVTVAPEQGKANQKVVELLAKQLHTAKSNIKLVSGATSRVKRFEVDL